MRRFLFVLIFMPLAAVAQSPAPDPLSATLPSGRVVHFETAGAKSKFLAAQQRQQQAQARQPSPIPQIVHDMGHTALDAPKPAGATTSEASTLANASPTNALNEGADTRIPINGTVAQVTKDGILVDCKLMTAGKWTDTFVLVTDYPKTTGVAEDQACKIIGTPSGVFSYVSVMGAERRVGTYKYRSGHIGQ